MQQFYLCCPLAYHYPSLETPPIALHGTQSGMQTTEKKATTLDKPDT